MIDREPHPLRARSAFRPPSAPQSVGEILSSSVAFMRRYFRVAFVASLPLAALELLMREGSSIYLSRVRGRLTGDVDIDAFLSASIEDIVFMFAALLLSRFAAQLVSAAATVHVDEVGRGRTPSVSEVLPRALRLAPRLLGAESIYALTLGILVLGPLAALIYAAMSFVTEPTWIGIMVLVWLVYAIVVVVVVTLRWALYPQTIVLEQRGVVSSLSRSAFLMRNRGARFSASPKVRFSLILLIYWAVSSSIQSMFLVPLVVIGWMQGFGWEEMPPPLSELPVLAGLPIALVQVAANSIILPLGGVLPSLFTLDAKLRIEGIDDDDDDDATA